MANEMENPALPPKPENSWGTFLTTTAIWSAIGAAALAGAALIPGIGRAKGLFNGGMLRSAGQGAIGGAVTGAAIGTLSSSRKDMEYALTAQNIDNMQQMGAAAMDMQQKLTAENSVLQQQLTDTTKKVADAQKSMADAQKTMADVETPKLAADIKPRDAEIKPRDASFAAQAAKEAVVAKETAEGAAAARG